MAKKKALICGVSGQDGGWLAKFLCEREYEVWGASRDAQAISFRGLERLGIKDQVRLLSMAPNDFRSVLQVLDKVRPDEVYNLAGQTSVGLSFEQQVANYREAYGLFACSGILFNHESPLRPPRFVTSKVISAACRIAAGSAEKLVLGNLEVERDWGWAPEYVDAMWRMLQRTEPQDYVVATGRSYRLSDFVAAAFAEVGLEWRQHVVQNPDFLRKTDILRSHANPARAARDLGWNARHDMKDVVRMMVEAERRQTA